MGWIDRFSSPSSGRFPPVKLPALDVRNVKLPTIFREVAGVRGNTVPNAALIYGIGAAILLAFALYSLFTGAWLTALLLLLPAGALFGFALHFLQYLA